MKSNIKTIAKAVVLGLILSVGVGYISAAWSNPTATPPGNNTETPINIGGPVGTNQSKIGGIWAGFLGSNGNAIINGTLQILGGAPGAGKVLTSDATGVASWTDASGLGGGGSGQPNFGSNFQVFDSGGTWTAPAGVTKVVVEAWGGGAGGQNGTCSVQDAVGGGGGSYSKSAVTVVPNTAYPIVVGAAGVGGSGTHTNGGDSSFGGVSVVADGGYTSGNGGAVGIGQITIGGGKGSPISHAGGSSPLGGSAGIVPGGGGNAGSGASCVGAGTTVYGAAGASGRVIVYW